MARLTFHKPPFESVLSAELLWAAAVVADRKNNGEYIKSVVLSDDGSYVVKYSNRDLIKQVIKSGGFEITEQDLELGRLARDWFQKELLVKTLKGDLSNFEEALLKACQVEEFSNVGHGYEIAIIASQIKAYHAGIKTLEALSDADLSPMAAVGSRVNAHVEVIKSVYSRNYNVYFVTGKTDTKHLVFFSYREKLKPEQTVSISGTVKGFRENTTQLNRVKVV